MPMNLRKPIEQDLNDPWFGYFPMNNDSNKERLQYSISKLPTLDKDTTTYINLILDNFGNDLLKYVSLLDYLGEPNHYCLNKINFIFEIPNYRNLILCVVKKDTVPVYSYFKYKENASFNNYIWDNSRKITTTDTEEFLGVKRRALELLEKVKLDYRSS